MAPAEFAALSRRWQQREERENLRAGLVAAVIVNSQPGRKRPVQPADFFRQRVHQCLDVDDLRQTLEAIAQCKRSA